VVDPTFNEESIARLVADIRSDRKYTLLPILLVGNKTELRTDEKTLRNLSKQGRRPITFEMGEEIVRKINAVKYTKCSSDGMGIK